MIESQSTAIFTTVQIRIYLQDIYYQGDSWSPGNFCPCIVVFHFCHLTIPSMESPKEFYLKSTHLLFTLKVMEGSNDLKNYLSRFVWSRVLEKTSIKCQGFQRRLQSLSLAIAGLEEGRKRESAYKMGMTRGHSVAAISIGILQLCFSVALIIPSFVLSSYGHGVNTSSTPYWCGFPVSVKRFRFVYVQICGVVRGFSKLISVLERVLDVSETCKLIYFLETFGLTCDFIFSGWHLRIRICRAPLRNWVVKVSHARSFHGKPF